MTPRPAAPSVQASKSSDLAVLILTHNEQPHINRALASIAPIAREVFVIDSHSTDQTTEIAQAHGAQILHHKFINQANQFQWALDHAPITAPWVMRLDADEIIEPDLAAAITNQLPTLSPDIAGINLKRKHIFLGRWIRHGGRYPLTLLRIWRHGQGRIENRWMDEHMIVHGGRCITLEGGFADHNLNDLTFFTDKHNKYATREAIDRLNQKLHLFPADNAVATGASSTQARLKRLLKEHLYNRLPSGVGPLAYFLWRFIAQRGFLDGREGLIYHVLQGFWYRFLVEAKLRELQQAISHLHHPAEIKAELARLTGLTLE
jgi:glycosyltransferase involved in cell wall biosynthesis